MDDDTDTKERITLVKEDGDAPGKADGPDIDALWPSFYDAGAAGAVAAQELPRLVVAISGRALKPGDAEFHVLPYFHMGAGAFGDDKDGQWFRFPFHEPMGGKLLTAHGLNIMAACNAISLHRLPWIRQAMRDFRPAAPGKPFDTPIFTKIEVTEMEEGEE